MMKSSDKIQSEVNYLSPNDIARNLDNTRIIFL